MQRFTLVVLAGLAVGCGGSGQYRMTGTVSYDGQPVPAGSLTFMPTGPGAPGRAAGFCQIVAGRFDTRTGRSPAGGRHRVLIDGFDGVPFTSQLGDIVENNPAGRPLFSTYVVEFDVPKRQGTVHDFAVPRQP